MRRTSQLQAITKRHISVAVSAPAASLASLASNVETPDLQETPQTVSVEKFMGLVHKPYVANKRVYPQQSSIRITETQAVAGESIREALMNKDFNTLFSYLTDIRKTGDWTSVTEGLARPEISLLLRTLIDGQLKELQTLNSFNNVVERDAIRTAKKSIERIINVIESLQLQLRHSGYEFSPSELERLLEFETLNYRYREASRLITFIESKSACDSVTYHNLKFRVLSNTDPALWKVNKKTLSPAAYRGTLKSGVAFSELLFAFSKSSAKFTPNLQSHKEIIAGFGQSGDLTQVRKHIEQVWGITSHSMTPTRLVPSTSALYPDIQLLTTIANVFGYNKASTEAMNYIINFTSHYKIDTKDNTHIWRVLARMIELEHQSDPTTLATEFNKMWDLMNSLNARFTIGLYNKRFNIFSAAQRLGDLAQDIPLLKEKALEAREVSHKLRIQKVLTKYLKGVALAAYSTMEYEKAVKFVKPFFTKHAVDNVHLKELLDSRKEIVTKVKKSREEFATLQRQYDEEEDEDSLW